MKTYIALFRGINVGGNHMLPMKELKVVLEKNGCVDVQTYIQSGNVILRSPSDAAGLAKRLTAAVSKSHGFEPRVLLLTRAEMERAATANPFPEGADNPKSLHLFFLAEKPTKPDLKGIDAIKERALRVERQGALPVHARRIRDVEAGRAYRKTSRRRGYGAQLAHCDNAARDGQILNRFTSSLTTRP